MLTGTTTSAPVLVISSASATTSDGDASTMVAGHNRHIGVAGAAKGRVKARQRATLVDDVGLEADAKFGILLLQKRKLLRLVGG